MLKDIILRWKAQGKTVIVAEHRLSYLKGVADRVIYMDSGEIKEDMPADTFWSLSADESSVAGCVPHYQCLFAPTSEHRTVRTAIL